MHNAWWRSFLSQLNISVDFRLSVNSLNVKTSQSVKNPCTSQLALEMVKPIELSGFMWSVKFNVHTSSVYPKACFLSYPGLPWGAIHNDPTLLLPKRTLTVFERLTLQLTSIVKKARCGSEEPRSQVSLPGSEVEKWNAYLCDAGLSVEALI